MAPSPVSRLIALGVLGSILLLPGCTDWGKTPSEPPLPHGTNAPVVSVTAPNGGEAWEAGSLQEITYSATDPDTPADSVTVAFAYSLDGGGTWLEIASDQPNSGTHSWTLPGTVSPTARVRVVASDGELTGSDSSDANFSIVLTGQNVLSFGFATGAPGDSVIVAVNLSNVDLVGQVHTDLFFDSTVVHFVRASTTGRAVGASFQAVPLGVPPYNGLHLPLFFPAESLLDPGDGPIVTMTFRLVGPAGSETDLMPQASELLDPDLGELKLQVQAGQIRVAATPADLTALVPARTVVGDTLDVEGTGFGSSQGSAQVLFTASGGEVLATALEWSETRVVALVPDGAVTGQVWVRNGSVESDRLPFDVAPRLVSYDQDLRLGVFQRWGCVSCHSGVGSGNLNLAPYEELVSGNSDHGPVLTPRRSAESIIIQKLGPNPPFGDRMPQGTTDGISAPDILAIADWIDQGARNN